MQHGWRIRDANYGILIVTTSSRPNTSLTLRMCPPKSRVFFAVLVLVFLPIRFVVAQDGAVSISGLEVVSPDLIRITYVAGGEQSMIELPSAVLGQLVSQIRSAPDAGRHPSDPPEGVSPAPDSVRSHPRRVGAVRGRSAITGEDYYATIIADSVITIRFKSAGVDNFVSLPPDLLPLLERHHRSLTGRVNDAEAQFWFDPMSGTVRFGFMRGFDYRLLIAVFAILVGIVVMLLIRLAISRIKRDRDELLAAHRHMSKIREAERSYLASELHDGPVQDLQRILRSYVDKLSTMTTDEQEAKMAEMENELRGVTSSLRSICSDLKPPVLVHFGLARAVEMLTRDFQTRNPGIQLDLEIGPDPGRLTMETRLALYRIVQEALTNVEKHAEPDRVVVTLMKDGNMVRMTVQDDGSGFRVPSRLMKFEHSGHYGLSGMLQRARVVDGRLDVSSRPGEGTRIVVSVPHQPTEVEQELSVSGVSG
ncbi:MAG: sensor histidine kinase [Rhodothermales bacterium]|nr:sensor histidine kinase [Rhodothermales bacterium]